MKLTRADVADQIEAVLNGRMSRLDADHWFIEIMDHEAAGMLTFDPASDERLIKEGLWSLQALDHVDASGIFLVSDGELRSAIQRLNGPVSAETRAQTQSAG